MSGMSLLLKNRIEIIPQTSGNRLENLRKSPENRVEIVPRTIGNRPENRSKSPENHVEIVPWTSGNRPENRSKSPDFTCNASWCHCWPPVGPPRPPQGDPRRPKAAQGWPLGRTRLSQGPHLGAIFEPIFLIFSGFVLGSRLL